MAGYKVGDPVMFGRGHGEKTRGTVTKVNRKTCKVRQDESRGTMKSHPIGTLWTVPFSLLKHDSSNRSKPSKRPSGKPFGATPITKSDDGVTGAFVLKVRPMTDAELENEGWGLGYCGGRPTVLVLSNGTVLYASSDDAGNGAGALFGLDVKGESFNLCAR